MSIVSSTSSDKATAHTVLHRSASMSNNAQLAEMRRALARCDDQTQREKEVAIIVASRQKVCAQRYETAIKHHQSLCDEDYFTAMFFGDLQVQSNRQKRYFNLLSMLEHVIASLQPYMNDTTVAHLRRMCIPANWPCGRWNRCISDAIAQVTTGVQPSTTSTTDPLPAPLPDNVRRQAAIDKTIRAWLEDPNTAPSNPSSSKKIMEDFLWMVVIIHIPSVWQYLLKPTGPHKRAPVLDENGVRQFLFTGDPMSADGQQNTTGRIRAFWGMRYAMYCLMRGVSLNVHRDPLILDGKIHGLEKLDARSDAAPTVRTVMSYAYENYWRITNTRHADVLAQRTQIERTYTAM